MRKWLTFIFVFVFLAGMMGNAVAEIDLSKASVEELELLLSLMDDAEAELARKKELHGNPDEMCKKAIESLKEAWTAEYQKWDEGNGYFQIINTRIIYLHTDSNDEQIQGYLDKYFVNENGSPMVAIVECIFFTDYFGSAPYYYPSSITGGEDNVAFYADGTYEARRQIINYFRGHTFMSDFIGIIERIEDMGGTYNETCYLIER